MASIFVSTICRIWYDMMVLENSNHNYSGEGEGASIPPLETGFNARKIKQVFLSGKKACRKYGKVCFTFLEHQQRTADLYKYFLLSTGLRK